MKLTLTFNQFVISLLTIATAGVVNNELQTRIIEMDDQVIAPSYVEFAPKFEEIETATSSISINYDRVNADAAREADLNRENITIEIKAMESSKVFAQVEIAEEAETEVEEIVDEQQEVAIQIVEATEVAVEEAPVERVINYPSAGTWEYELFVLVNQAREENGLAPYTYRYDLQDAAAVRASESSVSFSHTRPDGSDFWTVNSAIVYGENIAAGQTSAQQVFAEWMASPSHRANILSSDYESCGFGMVNNGDGVYNVYWAQEFGY